MLLSVSTNDNPTQWPLGMLGDWWVVFIISLIFTGVVLFFKKEPGIEIHNELQSIGVKLDALAKEVKGINKTIEE